MELHDQEGIYKLKEIASNDKRLFKELLSKNPDQNTVAELLDLLLLENLLNFLQDPYNEEYSYGYRLGIHAAKSLSNLYSNLVPFKNFLLTEREKFSHNSHINLDKQEVSLSQTNLIVEDILSLISNLLACNAFQYCQTINGKIFLFKQQASTIPNPHDIPKNFTTILNKNSKEAYRHYTDFLHFFTGNWEVGVKVLRQIKAKLDDLHKICPFIRFSMAYGLLSKMELDKIEALAPDIRNSLISLDLHDIILSHKDHLMTFLTNGITDSATITNLAQKLKHLIEILKNPLKDVMQLSIIMEQTIKIMLTMRSLQAGGHLTSEQNVFLQKMEKFFHDILAKQSLQVKEMVSIAYKIVGSSLEKIVAVNADKLQEASRAESTGVSITGF
jgi:hypothetical protein